MCIKLNALKLQRLSASLIMQIKILQYYMYNINKSSIIMSCAFSKTGWNVCERKKIDNKVYDLKLMKLMGKNDGDIYI